MSNTGLPLSPLPRRLSRFLPWRATWSVLLGIALSLVSGFGVRGDCETTKTGNADSLASAREQALESLIDALSQIDLSAAEIEDLKQARTGKPGVLSADSDSSSHWAYIPARPPEPPEVEGMEWCRNPIDRFILARLEKEGLEPSPPASKERWLRRVHFDLIGIPPTPEEVEEFLSDTSPDADKVVDRLLASPHYGERQAQFWLDLARYCAIRGGYHVDPPGHVGVPRLGVSRLSTGISPSIGSRSNNWPATCFPIRPRSNGSPPGSTATPCSTRRAASIRRSSGSRRSWTGWGPRGDGLARLHPRLRPVPRPQVRSVHAEGFLPLYALFNNTPDLGGGTYGSKEPQVFLLDEEQQSKLAALRHGIAEGKTKLETPTDGLSQARRFGRPGGGRATIGNLSNRSGTPASKGPSFPSNSTRVWSPEGLAPQPTFTPLPGRSGPDRLPACVSRSSRQQREPDWAGTLTASPVSPRSRFSLVGPARATLPRRSFSPIPPPATIRTGPTAWSMEKATTVGCWIRPRRAALMPSSSSIRLGTRPRGHGSRWF